MNWLPGNASHIGRRTRQQDAFALSNFDDRVFVDHGGHVAVVADGIGGLSYGGEAAQCAVSAFLACYLTKEVDRTIDDMLDDALAQAQQAVWSLALALGCAGGMGSTLAAAVIHADRLYWRAVGDSRIYLLRDGRLGQLNGDHVVARSLQRQVNDGLIDQWMAERHPDRDALDSFLGAEQVFQVSRNRAPLCLEDDDKVLLCSDGIYRTLTDEQIVGCLEAPPMRAAEQLVGTTLAAAQPQQDNLTAIVLGRRSTKGRINAWLSGWRNRV